MRTASTSRIKTCDLDWKPMKRHEERHCHVRLEIGIDKGLGRIQFAVVPTQPHTAQTPANLKPLNLVTWQPAPLLMATSAVPRVRHGVGLGSFGMLVLNYLANLQREHDGNPDLRIQTRCQIVYQRMQPELATACSNFSFGSGQAMKSNLRKLVLKYFSDFCCDGEAGG